MSQNLEVPIILLGLGNVGRAFLRQVLDVGEVLARRTGLRLVPIGLADVSGILIDADGLSEDTLRSVLRVTTDDRLLDALPQIRPLDQIVGVLRAGAILADLTASTETKTTLRTSLEAGCGVVLANKIPLCIPWVKAVQFFEHPHLRYEVTVGAGLPVISALRYLLNTGDQATVIKGCLSGTLGYLCAQLERGVPYSVAVSQAHSLGYTEPDPREDLSGRDVARKMLILARTVGWPIEMADVVVEPLYPEALAGVSIGEFLAATSTLDEEYACRVSEAQVEGNVLRYVARVDPDGGNVGLQSVPYNSQLGVLHGPANYIALSTTRYHDVPLVLSGPGAGPEVTAAGVVGDIIDLVNYNESLTEEYV